MIDRERLRRLALVARDDDHEENCQARMTPAELELYAALDPSTVLELLDSTRNTSELETGERAISLGVLFGRERELVVTRDGDMHLVDDGGGTNVEDWLEHAALVDTLELVRALARRAC